MRLRYVAVVLAGAGCVAAKQLGVTGLFGTENIPQERMPEMDAGLLTVDEPSKTRYFFWKFREPGSEHNKTVMWLNGGPGCSSMDGALMEVGPFRVNDDGNSVHLNEGSWYKAADVVFVDQPGGTGFSLTEQYDKDLDEVADDFYKFLLAYYEQFPQDLGNPLYLAGESYAGQYIPFIADKILRENPAQNATINLQGLIIGNGWIAPDTQSLSYIPYLLGAGILHTDDPFMPQLLKAQEECQNLINKPDSTDKFGYYQCENILNKILALTRDKDAPQDKQCINMYDTRLRDSYPSCGMNWPGDLPAVVKYLTNDRVIEGLNLNKTETVKWRECDNKVSGKLRNKDTKPSIYLLPSLLEQVQIVLFGGDKDIICNNEGVLDMIKDMSWGGSQGFTDAVQLFDWKYDDQYVGKIQYDKNLTFIEVYNSSHMVPFDKPFESRGLFDILVDNFEIVDSNSGSYVRTPKYETETEEPETKEPETETPETETPETEEPETETPDTDKPKTETPDTETPEDGKDKKVSKSPLLFILYLLLFIVIGIALYVYNRSKSSKSILRQKRTKHKRKTVSWADESAVESTSSAPQSNSKVSDLLHPFKPYPYESTPTDEIELQSQSKQSQPLRDDGYEDFDFDIDDEV